MFMSGCQGKDHIKIEDKPCPRCGTEIEIFSIDVSATCPECGFVIYNDMQNCVQWCEFAEQCVGPDQYSQFMKIKESQQARREAEAEAGTLP